MKTLQERVLTLASKKGTINSSVLGSAFKKSYVDYAEVHNSPARIMRQCKTDGLLKRTGRGEYTLTKKGAKAVAA